MHYAYYHNAHHHVFPEIYTVHVYIYTHTQMYIYTHTQIHTYIHIFLEIPDVVHMVICIMHKDFFICIKKYWHQKSFFLKRGI